MHERELRDPVSGLWKKCILIENHGNIRVVFRRCKSGTDRKHQRRFKTEAPVPYGRMISRRTKKCANFKTCLPFKSGTELLQNIQEKA